MYILHLKRRQMPKKSLCIEWNGMEWNALAKCVPTRKSMKCDTGYWTLNWKGFRAHLILSRWIHFPTPAVHNHYTVYTWLADAPQHIHHIIEYWSHGEIHWFSERYLLPVSSSSQYEICFGNCQNFLLVYASCESSLCIILLWLPPRVMQNDATTSVCDSTE